MLERADDVLVRAEERVRFDFAQRERDALLSEGTADFLQRVESWVAGGLHEVDVGEAAFAEQAEDFEGARVDAQGGRGGEAGEEVGEGPEGVEDVGGGVGEEGGLGLLHCCGGCLR